MTASGPDCSGPDRGNVARTKILDSDLVESTNTGLKSQDDGWTTTDAGLNIAALDNPHH